MRRPDVNAVALVQIAYWTFGAVWPLVSMRSFERVTGNKHDEWLVRTVSLLLGSVALSLEVMRRRGRDAQAMRVLGATSTVSVGGVALVGPLVQRISPVYLADAIVDLSLAFAWLVARGTGRAAGRDMQNEREQMTGPQGGDSTGGDGGGMPQRGFPPTLDEGDSELTHDPEPGIGRIAGEPKRP